jgi:hypothetical protein
VDVNTAIAVPNGPATGFQEPQLANSIDNRPLQEIGNATGDVWVEFLDPFLVQENNNYELIFEEVEIDSAEFTTGYTVFDSREKKSSFTSQDTNWVTIVPGKQLVEGSVSVTNLAGNTVDPVSYEVDFETARIRGTSVGSLPQDQSFTATYRVKPVPSSVSMNGEDNNPVFDGMRVYIREDPTGLDSLSTKGGRSGFSVFNTNTNFSDKFTKIRLAVPGTSNPYPSDFEIRFTDYDTTQDGNLVAPADSAIKFSSTQPAIETSFKIIDTETGNRVDFFINEVVGFKNNRWDWQETIVLIKPEATQITETTYQVKFSPPVDTLTSSSGEDSLVIEPAIYPGQGDVFLFFSTKPFDIGDKYTFETKAPSFQENLSESVLDQVYVVPNPYIAYSPSEIAFQPGIRDDKYLEFRNLPRNCTIRIYTIVGELVDTIEKNDNLNYAIWNLLTFESQQIAYGVYIYHIEAPKIGTKIGRFAVIK